jgi:hypothetical protein
MAERPAGTEVLAGMAGDLRWTLLADGTDDEFSTMLYVYRGSKLLAGSGFGGPKLYPGSLMNQWRGRTDDLPYFVMARVSPIIDRVVATTDTGQEITLQLSPVIDQFALRFAAAAMPGGSEPASIRVERLGQELESSPQPMPRFHR